MRHPDPQLSPEMDFFIAEVVGPSGREIMAGFGGDFRYGSQMETRHRERMTAHLDALVKALVADGWAPIPRGEHWYSYRFERGAG